MVNAKIIAWALTIINSLAPVGKTHRYPEAKEDVPEATSRRQSIAEAWVAVAYDPDEKPLFQGHYGRARTLVQLAAVGLYESGFRRDVDLGLGKHGRGDSGNSWCMMQFLLGHKKDKETGVIDSVRTTAEGWTGLQLVSGDGARERCFRAGKHAIGKSLGACRGGVWAKAGTYLKVDGQWTKIPEGKWIAASWLDGLAAYATGQCVYEPKGRDRMAKGASLFSQFPPPMKDDDAFEAPVAKATQEQESRDHG